MMIHPLVILTYIVGAGELVLALYFLKTNSGATIRKVMSLLCASTALWVLASAFAAYHNDNGVYHFANILIYIGGAMLLTALVHLVVIFPLPIVEFDALHGLLLYIPAIIFSSILLTTRTVFTGSTGTVDNPGWVTAGPLLPVYNSYLIVLYLLSVILLIYKAVKNSMLQKKRILILLCSLLIGGLPGVYIDLITPIFNIQEINPLYGVISSVFWLGGVTYILFDKEKGAR